MLHFVGFKDERVYTARRIFGEPDFWHCQWDRRAKEEIAPGDVVVFAVGDERRPPYPKTFDDSAIF